MNIIDYFQMRAFYYSQEDNCKISLRLGELEEIWSCSNKSVKRRIKQLVDEGRLVYKAGVGRGNGSTIIYNSDFQNEIKSYVGECLDNKRLNEIVQLLQLSIPQSWISDVSSDLNILFGKNNKNKPVDKLQMKFSNEIVTLDPLYSSLPEEVFLFKQLGDTLTIYSEKTDTVKPHIAHNWKVNSNNTSWIFYLRKNVYFHNNEQLTSKDVKYTFDRFMNNDSHYSWLVEDIAKIETSSDFIIEFRLKRANPNFLRYVSFPSLVILPYGISVNENKWIGSGPFQFEKRTKNNLILTSNKHYFLESPIVDEIEISYITQDTKETIIYENNDVREDHAVKEYQSICSGVDFLCFNFNRKTIVQDPSFREAIYHILDVGKMIEETGLESIVEAEGFQYTKRVKLNKNKGIIAPLLYKSGYKGEQVVLYFCVEIGIRQWFIDEMTRYGLNIVCYEFSYTEYYSNKLELEADLIIMDGTPFDDYYLTFTHIFKSRLALGPMFFSKDHLLHIEKFLEEMKLGKTKDIRKRAIGKIEKYIVDNNLMIFTYHYLKTTKSSFLINSIQNDSYDYINFSKLWIE